MTEIAEANDAQWQSNRPVAPTRKKTPDTRRKRVEATFIEPMRCKAVAALPEDKMGILKSNSMGKEDLVSAPPERAIASAYC